MKVVITGAGGQLGRELIRSLSEYDLVPLTRQDCDICDGASLRRKLTALRPGAVVNAAALTRVDECEDRVAAAFAVNACAVRTLAHGCAAVGAVLVHVSTDYVFGGTGRTPHGEEDAPGPLSVYGVSKLAGEYLVRSICSRYFIVRTSGLYGRLSDGSGSGNFVETMLGRAAERKKIRVVDDQVLTPTYTKDLAEVVERLMHTDAYGVYHVTNSGECSWYQFAQRIFAYAGITADVEPITSAAFGARAPRPPYSVLAHQKLCALGFPDLRGWESALAAYLRERADTAREATLC